MDGDELSELITRRWSTLRELLECSRKQIDAIESGQMSDLMRLLSDKQRPISELVSIAEQLRLATHDDPEQRNWASPEMRQRCRDQQHECETMHLELLAIEAECEATLSANRQEVQERLAKVDAGWQAASGYAHQSSSPTSGGQLDLSSD
ncbi:MAG: flagellar export chaperone FlgN [Rubripirellula sp.]